MYEAYYGLKTKPFQLNPDPTFYFNSKQHRRAKAYLEYGAARNEGFIVITGEIGAGKTTILSGLLASLNGTVVNVGQLVTTQLDAEDTLRMVAAAFGVRATDQAKAQLLITLEAFLVDQARNGRRCLLVVDEAQNLSPRAVEELRMLSNYQLGTQALLQTFLVGQPELKRTLQRPEMEQLRQRIAATCHIGPMDEEDTQHYIEHRLRCAGAAPGVPFQPSAFPLIYKASHGVPRRINSLCDRLLLAGFLAGKPTIEAEDVTAVVDDLSQEGTFGTNGANGSHEAAGPVAGDIDFSRLRLDEGAAESLSQRLDGIAELQQGDRLQRLERGLLRLERINLDTLELLKTLVKAARRPSDGDGP